MCRRCFWSMPPRSMQRRSWRSISTWGSLAGSPMPDYRVLPVTEDRWADVLACFGRRGNDPAWCWCQRFIGPPADGDNRAALHHQITEAAVPIGLIAFRDERPVGWTRVVTR